MDDFEYWEHEKFKLLTTNKRLIIYLEDNNTLISLM